VDVQDVVPLDGERKTVTALFADLVGSTSLAEGLDPEDWAVVVNRLYEVASRSISRYGGTVTQLSGDAIVAVFGAPVAHEDDPERAVRVGLDLITAVAELSARIRDEIATDLRMRVGVNTGLAVVGSVGGAAHEEYTALGDAMNVAARIQSAARPGTVLVTGATYERVRDLVEVVELGELEVKGKRQPVDAFEVSAIVGSTGRTRGILGLESPLVGRAAELEQLTGLFDLVRAGRGRAALVLGEPGIGKSRLIAELRAAGDDVRWVEGRCLSYGRSLPYHLIADLLTSMTGTDAGRRGDRSTDHRPPGWRRRGDRLPSLPPPRPPDPAGDDGAPGGSRPGGGPATPRRRTRRSDHGDGERDTARVDL
jgi:class 3 adenylate cyclase